MTQDKANPIGKCPMCDKHVELIDNTTPLREEGVHYHSNCKNEYYHHIIGEDNREFLYKFNPARTKRPFLGE